jgi:membrane protease subunit HflK
MNTMNKNDFDGHNKGFRDNQSSPKDMSDWRNRLDDDSFEYFVRDNMEKYGKKIRNITAGVGLGILALSSVYIVPGGNQGVVKTLGKYTTTTQEGPHLKIPFVQSVIKVNTDKVYEETFGYRPLSAGVKSEYIGTTEILSGKIDDKTLRNIIEQEGYKVGDNPKQQAADILREEYLMLTGDLNMADVEYSVQYKIVDPVKSVFNVREPRKLIRDYTQSCTKTVIGDVSIDEALTIGRIAIGQDAKKKINDELDYNQSGLQIIVYKMQSSNPPTEVRESFRSVNNALAEKQTKINNAKGQYNETVSQAQGNADRLINEAKGYAIKTVNTAQGDVALFRPVYEEFKRNPEITTSRIVMETLEEMMSGSTNTLDLTNQKNGLLLKQLNLGGSK